MQGTDGDGGHGAAPKAHRNPSGSKTASAPDDGCDGQGAASIARRTDYAGFGDLGGVAAASSSAARFCGRVSMSTS